MVRAVAGYDYDRAQAVLRWPMREALVSFSRVLRETAAESWHRSYVRWALTAPYQKKPRKAPPIPSILEQDDG